MYLSYDNLKKRFKYYDMEGLGSGTFGMAFKALDTETNQDCAIKIFLKDSSEYFSTFIREVCFYRYFDHPNIPKLISYSFKNLNTEPKFYIVLPFLRPISTITWRQQQQLIDCVSYLHSLGIGHLDIKEDNILQDEDGNIKLIDFGVSSFALLINSNNNTDLYHKGYAYTTGYKDFRKDPYVYTDLSTDYYALGRTILGIITESNMQKIENYDYRDVLTKKNISKDNLEIINNLINKRNPGQEIYIEKEFKPTNIRKLEEDEIKIIFSILEELKGVYTKNIFHALQIYCSLVKDVDVYTTFKACLIITNTLYTRYLFIEEEDFYESLINRIFNILSLDINFITPVVWDYCLTDTQVDVALYSLINGEFKISKKEKGKSKSIYPSFNPNNFRIGEEDPTNIYPVVTYIPSEDIQLASLGMIPNLKKFVKNTIKNIKLGQIKKEKAFYKIMDKIYLFIDYKLNKISLKDANYLFKFRIGEIAGNNLKRFVDYNSKTSSE